MKRKGESFSDVIEKLTKRRDTSISKYFGILRDSEVPEEVERCLESRKSARLRI